MSRIVPDSVPITDDERYPTLSTAGRHMLEFMREHPSAPIYRNTSGNRLTQDDVDAVTRFEGEVAGAPIGWAPGERPLWVDGFVDRTMTEVPFYRAYGAAPDRFEDLPTIDRGDLSRDVARFVPDGLPLDRLINFRTSGTTGHPLLLPSHPRVAGKYLAFHKRALRRAGIHLRAGAGRVGVMLLGHQRKCFTYVSVTPTMGESGLAKINLHPNDWRDADDRQRYLDAMAPEVYAGDPISYEVLLTLPVASKPRAILCTSMALLPDLRQRLEERFECPVLDLYSMNEAGPIACSSQAGAPHHLLQPGMFVEILDRAGDPMPAGERGEVALTGGFNDYLPLIRYRTGDWASLRHDHPEPVLVDLEGRPPVRFRTQAGEWINNIEVTHLLQRLGLPQFSLHQGADGELTLRVLQGSAATDDARDRVMTLFGPGQVLELERVPEFEGKIVQYTSDVEGSAP